ncbi:MAG: apolipoprotein N-acyltransferase [Betaproteobacteria bacterium]|nr:apolipoprotein N-acyltransferase [Betaproteobacteria bacterium]
MPRPPSTPAADPGRASPAAPVGAITRRAQIPRLLAAMAVGAAHALSLSFLPGALAWPAQLLTLAAGLWLAAGATSRRQSGLRGFAFAMGHFLTGLCWLHVSMHDHGGMPWLLAALALLLFCAYLALWPALALMIAHDRPGWGWVAGVAGAWALAEAARGWVFTGFPWLSIGYAHVDGPLGGLAPLVGVYGVGLAAAALAALLALGALRRREQGWRAPAIAVATMLLASAAVGELRFTQPAGGPMSVRLVQGDIAQSMKFDPQAAVRAMRWYAAQVAASQARLTVLPETAWVVPWTHTPPEIAATVLEGLRASGGSLLLGAPIVDAVPGAAPRVSNSALLLAADAPAPRYDKQHLVPFGEFIPWGFGWFVRLMNIPMGSFGRGVAPQAPFLVAGQRVAANICYEDLFGEEIAAQVREPVLAGVLVNLSNLGWFGDSHALSQHLQISRMRALETGRPMLRATNTGVTAHIDHRARVVERLPTAQAGVIDTQVQATEGLTPYARLGNLPVLLLAGALLAVATGLRRTPASEGARPSSKIAG